LLLMKDDARQQTEDFAAVAGAQPVAQHEQVHLGVRPGPALTQDVGALPSRYSPTA
jgi:hypothetical protein